MKTIIYSLVAVLAACPAYGQGFTEGQKLVAADRNTNAFYGDGIKLTDQNLFIGATGNDSIASSSGAVYIYEKPASEWVLDTMLIGPTTNFNDQFGNAIDIDGNDLMIGAFRNDTSGVPSNGGSVFYYENTGSQWEFRQKIVSDDVLATDFFGESLAISGDYLAVGAPRHDYDLNVQNFISESGAVYIFKKNGSGQFDQIAKLISPSRSFEERFGITVALSGNDLLIGARGDDEDVNESGFLDDAGAVYYFQNDGGDNFNLIQKLVASDRGLINAFFGDRLVLDGNRLFVKGITANNLGGLYYFMKIGNSWIEQQRIESVSNSAAVRVSFGSSITVENNRLILGSPDEENFSEVATGLAYYYEFNGLNWELRQRFFSEDLASSDLFGYAVALNNDEVVSGARQHDLDENGNNPISASGAAYIFDFDPGLVLNTDEIHRTEILVYPNPSNGLVRIRTFMNHENARLKLYSVSGQLIDIQIYGSGMPLIYKVDQPGGMYLLEILIDEHRSLRKIIKH